MPHLMSKLGCRQNDDALSLNVQDGRLALELPPRGAASTPLERLAAFKAAWWFMVAITAAGVIPIFLIQRKR